MSTNESDEDIIKSLDHCKGEWVNKRDGECHDEPCKKIKQYYIINNPDYTGEHCRDKEGRRLREDDSRHVFCNHDQDRCSGNGKCEKGDVKCKCETGYSGPNCDVLCEATNCNNGNAVAPDCKCECNPGYGGNNCDVCLSKDCGNGTIDQNTCRCVCNNGYTGDKCNISPNKCNYPTKINCNNGTCVGGNCNCDIGWSGSNCEIKQKCAKSYCYNGLVYGYFPNCKCECNYGYTGEKCDAPIKCNVSNLPDCKNGTITGHVGNCKCVCGDGFTGSNCETYDCDKLINELKNIPNDIIQFFINDNHRGEEYKNIEDIIDTNTITGIHLNMSTLNFKENYDLILEHKILEKIFSCTNIIFIYLDAYTTTFILDHKEIFNNIMDKVKEYDKLKYVKLVINPGRDLVLIEFIIVISTKYYNNILLRELKSQNTIDGEEIYFANPIETPCIYIVPGISISDLQNNCKLIEKLHNDRNYNKHIPLEYFRDC